MRNAKDVFTPESEGPDADASNTETEGAGKPSDAANEGATADPSKTETGEPELDLQNQLLVELAHKFEAKADALQKRPIDDLHPVRTCL